MDDKTKALVWMIRVQGYGTFEFVGTEHEAEEMRAHKARHERGASMKWRKDLSRESDRLSQEIAELFDAGEGIDSKLFRALDRARKEEAAQ